MRDPEIARWVDAQPRRLTYSELAASCTERFGAARAWDAEKIRAYCVIECPKRRSRIEQDGELLGFLRERIGRFTLPELLAECRRQFPEKRLPSNSALHRWTQCEGRRLAMQSRSGK